MSQVRSTGDVRGRTTDDLHDEHDVRVLTATETRRSLMTTEFWAMVIAIAGLLLTAYIDDSADALSVDRAWLFSTIIATGYIVSRGLAKSGAQEAKTKRL